MNPNRIPTVPNTNPASIETNAINRIDTIVANTMNVKIDFSTNSQPPVNVPCLGSMPVATTVLLLVPLSDHR